MATPAFCTSLGRVLLADLADVHLDAYLERLQPQRRTERTITDKGRLREIVVEARRQGWTMVDQEMEDGVRSIAAPLRGRDGRAVAALNCSTHAGRVGLRELRSEFVPVLVATAAEISTRLARR